MPGNKQIIFQSRPAPKPTTENFKYTTDADIPDASSLEDNQALVQLKFVSVDPYMRGRMNAGAGYFVPGWEIGSAPDGGVVAEIVASKNQAYAAGDLVVARLPWIQYQIVGEKTIREFIKIDPKFHDIASYFIGSCGMPGLSAYLSILKIGQPKAGETAFISGAAGAVGSVAGQILKLMGLKVYGSAGTDEKVEHIKGVGFDGAFNYKNADLDKEVKKLSPEGFDIYFDNVGGETLEVLLNNMKLNGRVIMCGSISQYNSTSPYGVKNLFNVTTKRLLLQGFIAADWLSDFPAAGAQLVQWVKEGKLKVTETIREGFENLPSALVGIFDGENTGKMIVKI
eukprot:TRINITY_DN9401_c0_g1_i1.p1 TRINITY_DN9401_c0_g1~~TRINITY_DN9401_c0_g1_i1.p1  ORF type:complete len:350 (+),score=159.47 TRINITY_DN9401_c0_g1_i1:31-1050(+)